MDYSPYGEGDPGDWVPHAPVSPERAREEKIKAIPTLHLPEVEGFSVAEAKIATVMLGSRPSWHKIN
jgi:hypothetical protein